MNKKIRGVSFMKVLFCHDGPIVRDDEDNYYGIAHNDEMFRKYFKISPNLKVAIRLKEDKNKNIKNRFKKINEPIEFIECPNLSSLYGQLFDKKRAKKILTEVILEVDYIVVRFPSMLGNIAYDIAKKLKKPCLVEVVACPWDIFTNHSFKGKIIAPYAYYAMKKRVYSADYVNYVTKDFLQTRYPTKGKQIGISDVVLEETNSEIYYDRLSRIKKIKSDYKIVIGTTAAIDVKYKGQQYVIQALGKLKEQGITNFEYQVVGGGDPFFLKNEARKNNVLNQVKFLGGLPHDKVFPWLDSIDLYIQPSKTEGLPRALVEAMSRALPAIGTEVGGIPELLEKKWMVNNKSSVSEIVDILKNINPSILSQAASDNFIKAKEYNKKYLEEIRQSFYIDFKREI